FDASSEVRHVGVQAIEGLAGITPINVAESHDVLACQVNQVAAAHAADTDAGDVHGVARRRESSPEHVPRNDGECGASGCYLGKKSPSREALVLVAHGLSYNRTARALAPDLHILQWPGLRRCSTTCASRPGT